LLEADGSGAAIDIDALPRSAIFTTAMQQAGFTQPDLFYTLLLSAGDDYELCFTVPAQFCEEMELALSKNTIDCTAIGVIQQQSGIRCHRANGDVYQAANRGYQHFGDEGSG
jgi:thiamine-monophosphate kinase